MSNVVAEFVAKLGLVPEHGSWEKGDKLIEGLKHGLEILGVFEGVEKVKEMVETTVHAAVAAKELSQKLGISTEAVQELGYAADVTGGSGEGMQVSMQHLARGLQELRTKGTGPTADAFKSLGVNVNDSEVKHGNLDQVLEIVADRFAAMPDGVAKTSAAMQLFGRSGTELLPLLNKGSGGIKGLREEAERLGVVIGDEGVEKAHEFEISQKRLNATITGLKNEAVIALLPALQEMVEGLSKWIGANREAIASTLEAVIHGVAEAFSVVGEVISGVTEFFKEHEKIAMAVLETLGIAIAVFAANAAAGWIEAFAPFLEAGLIIAGLILVVQDLWESIETGQGIFADVGNAIESWVEGAMKSLQDLYDYIVGGFTDAWNQVKDIPILGGIINGVGAVANFLGGNDSTPQSAWQGLQGSVPQSYGGGGGGGGGDLNATFGGVSVQVDAKNVDEDSIGGIVADKVQEAQKKMIKQTYEAARGGHR